MIPTSPALSPLVRPGFGQLQARILESLLAERGALHSSADIISWFTGLKMAAELDVFRCDLASVEKWRVSEMDIAHEDGRFFRVIGVEAAIGNREVRSWCQPLVQQQQTGLVGFVTKSIDGILHLLIQAKLEAGNFDLLEMAPTVQCITGSYQNPEWAIPYLDWFIGDRDRVVHYDTRQSEEGGRFYREENRHMLVEIDEASDIRVDPHYIWMTFRQAKEFIRYNNYFNVEARSLIACVAPV